jgi:hypothetical protein
VGGAAFHLVQKIQAENSAISPQKRGKERSVRVKPLAKSDKCIPERQQSLMKQTIPEVVSGHCPEKKSQYQQASSFVERHLALADLPGSKINARNHEGHNEKGRKPSPAMIHTSP